MARVEQALEVLARFIPEARIAKMKSIARQRSTHVALLMENIVDFGNHNAALRTMEALGLHKVHRVGVNEGGKKNRIEKRTDAGSKHWLSIRDWNTTLECVKFLRGQGYRIVSSSLNACKTLHDIQTDKKTAIAFGNERSGISQELEDLSDCTFFLPMWGFVQSYNISVAVAITMFHCRSAIENQKSAALSDEEYNTILLSFYKATLGEHRARIILKSSGVDPSLLWTTNS